MSPAHNHKQMKEEVNLSESSVYGCCLVKDSKPEELERHTCIPDPEKLCDNQCLLVKVSRFGVILCIAMDNSNIAFPMVYV